MNIVIFGLAITSSWGNGHATTYRSLCKALARRGHQIVFFEHDAEWYANNRDLPEPPFCKVVNYSEWENLRPRVRAELNSADVAVLGSYFPQAQEAMREISDSTVGISAFYDIDTPITLSQLRESGCAGYISAADISKFDLYLSFTGGPALRELETVFHAPRALPLYCSVDPEKHKPCPPDPDFACAMSYMGTYAPDRQPKLEELFCRVAREMPNERFILAGPQYPAYIVWPNNVRRIDHLEPQYHSLLYSSSRLVLNVTRRDMAIAGHSPSVRLFEAAACGAAVVSDVWPGLERLFTPGCEILTAAATADVLYYLREYDAETLTSIAANGRSRVLAEHSSERRAEQFENYIAAAAQRGSCFTQAGVAD